ncbi:MAG: arylamine N-acetyltransferase [Methylomonas sp.]|jgi:N-hydroxyarylamine O-acetyltransferase|uniref:arylamine N-acetyltransferase family protein n=1 Tax=Methylomonas sp. TaxID=418 RepID=UPI0025D00132|nr:arylamine N-acetyltransferase [Methylomonas sp.]MCK9604974.1 arylamine N-acetyltransferase [Methylomonas sp.]
MTFRINDYLTRIGISRPEPTADGLAQIQQAQLNAIAFENINPLLGVLPNLETPALVEKVLRQGRGGYCFELNGLLALTLNELGFDYEPIMARVRMGRSEGGPRHHLAFIVEADGEAWLVDTGFGGPSARLPLRLEYEHEQRQNHDTYRIRHEVHSGERVLEKRQDDGWFALYSFDRATVRRCDVDAANILCSTWDQSPLSRNLLLCRNTELGRIHLYNRTFTEFNAEMQTSMTVETAEHLGDLVRNHFGVAITDSKLAAIAIHLGLL